MTETTPHYFVEFEKRLNMRFDGIEEQLGDLIVRMTTVEADIKEIKEDLKAASRRADRHSEKIIIGIQKLNNKK